MGNTKFVKKWERNRKKGKIVYILIYCFALSVSSLVGVLIAYFITGKISFDSTLGLTVGAFIGGIILGTTMWYSNENKYMASVNRDQKISTLG